MTKYLCPVLETTGYGPQTSEWTKLKADSTRLLTLGLNEMRWCFANLHDSQSNEEIFWNWEQSFFNTGKEGWPNRQCASNGDTTVEKIINRGSHSSRIYRSPDTCPLTIPDSS